MKRMKLNFKKIASILAGTVMLSSTLAFAAAANTYPAPFVKSGSADVAVVYGSQPGAEFDLLAVADITTSLQAKLAAQTATGGSSSGVTISGEAAPLYTSSSNLYLGNALNAVKSTVTKTELPTVLADGTFSGNVDTTYTQTLTVGSSPVFTFSKMPTTDEQPGYGFNLSTSTASQAYNATVTFNKAVAFNNSDSEGQDITLFGQRYTIASATDATNLVLFRSAQSTTLTNENAKSTLTVGTNTYDVELISVNSDGTKATVQVTNPSGVSETKDISSGSSKKVAGITVAITSASANNFKYSATLLAGTEKITLTTGSAVKMGEEDTTVDGTLVTLTGTSNAEVSALTKIVISVAAKDSDHDAILPGMPLNDPVFGSFKLDLAGVSVPANSSAREDVKVYNSGDDKMMVSFAPYYGEQKAIQFAKNESSATSMYLDDNQRNITLVEGQKLYKNEYVVVGVQDEAHLLKVSNVYNDTSSYTNDKVEFSDVYDGSAIKATITSEGAGTVTVGGKVYSVVYSGTGTNDNNWAELDYPDSSTAGQIILYPNIKTSLGANVAFYKPVNINMSSGAYNNAAVTGLYFPDGDKYNTVTTATFNVTDTGWLIGGVNVSTTRTGSYTNVTAGALTYNVSGSGTANVTTIKLIDPATGGNINAPAIVIFDAKDNNNAYGATIVTIESNTAGTSSNGIGVNSVSFTSAIGSGSVTKPDNTDISMRSNYFGTIYSIDAGDSDQQTATVSYPKEQVVAQMYAAANAAQLESSVASSGTVKELGSVSLTDTQAAQVSGKNLIVVGGSCVNRLASELLSGSGCGSSWETKTGVGAGQFLIQSFERTGGKVATLVAGYNAEDTRNAAKVLISDATVDLTAGKKYKSTSATSVQMVTTAA